MQHNFTYSAMDRYLDNVSDIKLHHILEVLGISIFGISLSAFLGHVVNKEWLYRWIGDVGMAFNTSIVFMLVGVAFFVLSARLRHNAEKKN